MNTNSRKYTSIWAALFASVLALSSAGIQSAPGTLVNTPLFTTTSAEPNIFFMVDDSGSMDADLLTPESNPSTGCGSGCEGLMEVINGSRKVWYGYTTKVSDNAYSDYVVPTVASANTTKMPGIWRARNSNYNRTYYDSSVTYGPWSGVDSAGAAYSDASPTAARLNPYSSSSSTFNMTVNQTISTRGWKSGSNSLTSYSFTYMPMLFWVWDDTNTTTPANAGNGVVDADDEHTLVTIISSNQCTGAQTSMANGCFTRSYADEKQNFANWWTYHRRREYGMKAAVAAVISSANGVRMGISAINASSSEREEIASMNADPSSGNKNTLMDTLFTIQSYSGTPLEDAMRDSGKYFDCNGTSLFGNSNCPLETSAVSPATEAAAVCQQNFLVFLTDGYLTDSVTTYGDADSDNSSWSSGGTTYQFDEDPYQDNRSNTLADIAMYFYERDLNGAANSVPMQCGVDENPGQHMVTYTVSFGQSGDLDLTTIPDHPNRGYASSCTATTGSAFTWTNPSTPAGKIDELVHAAYNGRGEYYNANNPEELSNSLNNALTSISNRKGSAASVSFNSSVLNSNSTLFLGLFNSANWSGQLLAYSLDSTNGDVITPYDWDAGAVLDAYSPSSRNILTMGSSDGVAFQWANLTTAQKNDLKTNTSGGTDNDATGMARHGFIRGDRGCETGNSDACSYTDSVPNTYTSKAFRARSSVLGDIIHSSTVFVGAPELSWPDIAPFPTSSTYSAFKAGSAASRTEVVYTGANDGMLHGFRVSDGQELLAYIPSNLFSTTSAEGLHYLTNPSYNHRYYVDQTPVISDVYIDASGGGSATWTTVLVGSERAGGRGLFALNITDPTAFSESGSNPANIVMWEFTDDNLGYTFSKPTIALLDNGKWAAVFGNGYNEAGSGSWDGEAKLFILFLDGGVDGTWTTTTDYIVITTGSGTTGSPNGLSTPTLVDMDGNGTADRVYAGDLNGDMWAFDISGSNTNQWDSAYKQGATPKPLFNGVTTQPITVAPEVVKHPSQPDNSSPSNAPNVMVMFGTGQYMATGDNATTSTQSFYAVWDEGTKDLDTTNLQEQTFETGTFTGTTQTVRVPTDTAVDWTSKYGWYINLGDTGNEGERVISAALARGDLIYFNTLIPSVNPCSLGGSSWFMAVKLENGGRPDSPAFDTTGNNVVDGSDVLSDGGSLSGVAAGGTKQDATFGGPQTLADYRYDTSPDGDVPTKGYVESLDSSDTGRLSWEELTQ